MSTPLQELNETLTISENTPLRGITKPQKSPKPQLSRQVYAVFMKNMTLQFRHPVRFIFLFIVIPGLISYALMRGGEIDFPQEDPINLDPDTHILAFDPWSSPNKEMFVGADPKVTSTVNLGQVGPRVSNNSGLLSHSSWSCGSLHQRDQCPSHLTTTPETKLVEGKKDFDLELYNLYGKESIVHSFFINELDYDSNKLSVTAYLNTTNTFHLNLADELIVYDRSQWIRTLNFFIEAVRRFYSNPSADILSYDLLPAVQAYPFGQEVDLFNGLIIGVLYFLGLLILPLVYLPFIGEKKSKVLSLCRVLGMSGTSSIIGNLLSGSLLFVLISFFLAVPGKLFDIRFFRMTNFFILLLLFVGHGVSISGISMFLTSITPSINIGIVISLVSLSVLASFTAIPAFLSINFNYVWSLIPGYSIYNSYWALARNACNGPYCKGTRFADFGYFLHPFFGSIINGLVYSFIGHLITSLWSGTKLSVLVKSLVPKSIKSVQLEDDFDVESAPVSNIGSNNDLNKERSLALGHDELAVAAVDVSKVYNPHSIDRVEALKRASIAVPSGHCRILLGANGSGKTTLLNILTGQLSPSSCGRISINGFSVFSELDKVCYSMGFVPQFSTFWPDLTVMDACLFFARLKLPKNEVKVAVVEILRLVGLYQSKGVLLQALSGGMKRRASIAFALVGRPNVLIADELTTGISYDLSQQIWSIINSAKQKGVSMIISTHNLNEAEVLGDTISIQKEGDIMCIGTAENLKMRFGQGFKLLVSCLPEKVTEAISFIRNLEPRASHVSTTDGVLQYQLPKDVSMANVFKQFNEHKNEVGIVDFGVQSSSLDDVFVSVNQ
ncbi:hypothetical protein P9112_008872 [Eukaryota sp. TZLM1-RC]